MRSLIPKVMVPAGMLLVSFAGFQKDFVTGCFITGVELLAVGVAVWIGPAPEE